jgi:sporulation protein YlmC with PRC-barrel domain
MFPIMKTQYFLVALVVSALSPFSQAAEGRWDEIVGKRVVNHQGVTLGRVVDSVIDLEHGRYIGMLVSYGGFLGIGTQKKVVPPGALTDDGSGRTLQLDMDVERFRNAPTFPMSRKLGPPPIQKVAAVYDYFGQSQYFADLIRSAPATGGQREQIGFTQPGSQILRMPVETLQGKSLGHIVGLRDLNRNTGRLGAVIVRYYGYYGGNSKAIRPQALRYNLQKNRLRLNDKAQPFDESADFSMGPAGYYTEQRPFQRPDDPRLALAQGNSPQDRKITSEIMRGLERDSSLSHYAKRIQVGTVNGRTILRGRVETPEGKAQIEAIANRAAGGGRVTNLLNVEPRTGRAADRD